MSALREAAERLQADGGALERLRALKGWEPAVLDALGVGLEDGRLMIPVLDARLSTVGVLRYQPNPDKRGERPKMMAAPGTPRELFPPPELLKSGTILLVEGEPDAISATSIGFTAVGVAGSQSWKTEWASRFTTFEVVICGDCDGPGRGLAARVADDLLEHAKSVRIIDIAPARDDGYDIGDLISEASAREAHDLLTSMIEHTPLHLAAEDRPPRPRIEPAMLRTVLLDYLDLRTNTGPTWPIPFEALREATDGGIRAGELWIVAGYTSHAKSIYMDELLDKVSDAGARSHLYMTEMTLVQRGLRAIARRSGTLSMSDLRRHGQPGQRLSANQMAIARETVAKLPYGATIVNGWSPRHVAKDIVASRTQVAVIDLLHGFHYDSERELSKIVHEFADAAASDAAGLDGGCAIVLGCHLNDAQMRDSRSSARPRPGLHSLKGASAIKQRADTVLFTWLEDDDDGRPGTEGEVWIAKGRNGGATGSQKVRLDTRTLTLTERWA